MTSERHKETMYLQVKHSDALHSVVVSSSRIPWEIWAYNLQSNFGKKIFRLGRQRKTSTQKLQYVHIHFSLLWWISWLRSLPLNLYNGWRPTWITATLSLLRNTYGAYTSATRWRSQPVWEIVDKMEETACKQREYAKPQIKMTN